ncbi:MAG: hypothetical protein JWM33_905 [Caulobacteraceae bacterium]|nr:hypothetical protein [Caulobacteraceae bacterium]
MTLGYVPRRERHAIAEFTASVRLARPVGPTTFSAILDVLREKAKVLSLPAQVPFQTFQFAFGNQIGNQFPIMEAPGGAGFQRFAANGEVAMSLLCDNASITFTLREYESWEKLRPLLGDAIEGLLKVYALEVPAIQAISLQYLNEFTAVSDENIGFSELFRSGSSWIPPHAISTKEAWHSHVGGFVTRNNWRSLVNVNCDVLPPSVAKQQEPQIPNIRLLILAGSFYNLPDQGPLVFDRDNFRDILDQHLNISHDLEKEVLAEVLSDPYLTIIGASRAN